MATTSSSQIVSAGILKSVQVRDVDAVLLSLRRQYVYHTNQQYFLCPLSLFLLHSCQAEFRERNAVVAQKWAALTESSRKEWAVKAEAACSAAVQVCL